MRDSASVVIIGAGLSGLSAAYELTKNGVEDLVLLEAQTRPGGRVQQFDRDNGSVLMKGGEFTGPSQVELHKLAAEFGIGWEPMPPFAQDPMGKFVRVHDGARFVEDYPLAEDPEAAAQYAATIAAIDRLAAEVPHDKPWTAPRARELDQITIGAWLSEHVSNPAAYAALESEIGSMGDLHETSVFYLAWFLSGFGGWEAHASAYSGRFLGGSAQITQNLVSRLTDKIELSAPVRRVRRDGDSVIVDTDRGSVEADAVIVAIEPGQCAKIEFDPVLPAARDRLQIRWLAGHGAKFFAIYDTPFWRKDGLAGIASGGPPIQLAIDLSPSDGSEGILCALFFATSSSVARYSELLEDPQSSRDMVLDALETYFGPEARSPREFEAFDWSGDRWSDGCGSQLPLGVLSTLGASLREPVGRIFWAGNDSGDQDFMEGAVTAGQRAAREAAQMVGG